MKLPADKLRTVIREEIQRVLKEQGGDYSETGFHRGSKQLSWSEAGQHPDFGLEGKTISSVNSTGGRDHVEITFQDGTKISFFTDGQLFYSR